MMDTLHSPCVRSDSFDSVGSFAVLSASDPHERRRQSAANRDAVSSDSGEYDDDEWEVLSDDSNQLEERRDTIGAAASTIMMTSVVMYDRYFDAASMPPRPTATEADDQPECEHEPPDSLGALDSCTFVATVEPPLAASAGLAPLSPSSKSRHAREVLYCTIDDSCERAHTHSDSTVHADCTDPQGVLLNESPTDGSAVQTPRPSPPTATASTAASAADDPAAQGARYAPWRCLGADESSFS